MAGNPSQGQFAARPIRCLIEMDATLDSHRSAQKLFCTVISPNASLRLTATSRSDRYPSPPSRNGRLPIAAKMALCWTHRDTDRRHEYSGSRGVIGNQQRLIRSHIEEFGQSGINYQLALSATEPLFTDRHYEIGGADQTLRRKPARVLGAGYLRSTTGKGCRRSRTLSPRRCALRKISAKCADMTTADMLSSPSRINRSRARLCWSSRLVFGALSLAKRSAGFIADRHSSRAQRENYSHQFVYWWWSCSVLPFVW